MGIIKKRYNKKAFSLLELIFVISILGIIAALGLPKLLNSRGTAIVNTVKQDVSTITTAIQSYHLVNGSVAKITDTVNINSQIWTINDTKIEYMSENKSCIKIEIVGKILQVNILKDNSLICQDIYDSGIRDVSYDLY